uniref:Uncharacterized protein n=1 Tax=Lepeophtheirus salmonis TaxID=72036 RepID=A0A0K2SZH0_LEPSM
MTDTAGILYTYRGGCHKTFKGAKSVKKNLKNSKDSCK